MLHYDNNKAPNFPFTSHIEVSSELLNRPFLMAINQYAMAQLPYATFQVNPSHSAVWQYNGRSNPLPTTGCVIRRKQHVWKHHQFRPYWVLETRKLRYLGQVTQGQQRGEKGHFCVISILCCTVSSSAFTDCLTNVLISLCYFSCCKHIFFYGLALKCKQFIIQGVDKSNIFRCFFNNYCVIRKQCMTSYKYDTINPQHY